MDLLLSMFPKRDITAFHIKNGKGFTKTIKIGATVVESKLLTILANPFVDTNKFALRRSTSGGIVLEQSYDGTIELNITPDAKLVCQKDEPENFIKVSFRRRANRKWENVTAYIVI